MTKKTVARRYAKALFNLLEPSTVDTTRAGLLALSGAWKESAKLKHALISPVFTFEEKQEVLTAFSERTGCPPIMKVFFGQLLKKNRAFLIPEIAEAFREITDLRQGIQGVSVLSARDLDSDNQERLTNELESLLNQKVDVTFGTNPSLLAGLQIRIGSKVYDSTVQGRLTKMKALLAKG